MTLLLESLTLTKVNYIQMKEDNRKMNTTAATTNDKVYYNSRAVSAGIIGKLDFRGPFNVIRRNHKSVVIEDDGESVVAIEYIQDTRP